jgi:hypothetical protein
MISRLSSYYVSRVSLVYVRNNLVFAVGLILHRSSFIVSLRQVRFVTICLIFTCDNRMKLIFYGS